MQGLKPDLQRVNSLGEEDTSMKGKPGAMGKGKMTFGSEKKMPNTNKGKMKGVGSPNRQLSENKPNNKNKSGSNFGLL
jgi:hypothetical protein